MRSVLATDDPQFGWIIRHATVHSRYRKNYGYRQDATLPFRIEVDPNEALRTVAYREHCSIANMVEVLIRY